MPRPPDARGRAFDFQMMTHDEVASRTVDDGPAFTVGDVKLAKFQQAIILWDLMNVT